MAQTDARDYEADQLIARVTELRADPVRGNFDAAHLREIHRRIFQDFPEYAPGEFRPDAPSHEKARELDGAPVCYTVPYPRATEVALRLAQALPGRQLVDEFKSLDRAAVGMRRAKLYGDLDTAHGFVEGNSRTLRELTRQLAAEAGHKLEWESVTDSKNGRDMLYLARDRELFMRQFPGCERSDFEPADRTQHEAQNIVAKAGRAYPLLEKVVDLAYRGRIPPEKSIGSGAAIERVPGLDR